MVTTEYDVGIDARFGGHGLNSRIRSGSATSQRNGYAYRNCAVREAPQTPRVLLYAMSQHIPVSSLLCRSSLQLQTTAGLKVRSVFRWLIDYARTKRWRDLICRRRLVKKRTDQAVSALLTDPLGVAVEFPVREHMVCAVWAKRTLRGSVPGRFKKVRIASLRGERPRVALRVLRQFFQALRVAVQVARQQGVLAE